jgi:hypothetical protein
MAADGETSCDNRRRTSHAVIAGPLELGAKNYALNGQGYFRGQKVWVNWYADNTLKITRYAAGAEITVPAAETLAWIPQTQEALTDIDTGQVITPQYATYDRHAEGINISG